MPSIAFHWHSVCSCRPSAARAIASLLHLRDYFQPRFAFVYCVLPAVLVVLLWHAYKVDPEQRGNWRDLVVLAVLALVVEFRVLEGAWPQHVRSLNRLLLFDTGLYGFLVIRRLSGVGFNLWPRIRDFKVGLRELTFYAPIAIPLGLALGFLHAHRTVPSPASSSCPSSPSLRSWRFSKKRTSADGCKTCWSAESAERGRCLPPRCFSAFHTSIRAPRTSIGDTCCWRRSPASSTVAHGGQSVDSSPQV